MNNSNNIHENNIIGNKKVKKIKILAIRRENKSEWERRVALTPKEVIDLLQQFQGNLTILVQPSTFRIFSDFQYQQAGAIISEDISNADIIIGVKEVDISMLYPGKSYFFFSHVIKAQPYNMPLLDKILESQIQLFDYEKITDNHGKRLVAFGRFAGIAGVIEFLSGFGMLLLKRGYRTPFIHIDSPYRYQDIEHAKKVFNYVKLLQQKDENDIPYDIFPLVLGVIGGGRCAEGANEMLQLLDIGIIQPEQLQELLKPGSTSLQEGKVKHLIYLCKFRHEHLVQKLDENQNPLPFDKNDYYKQPETYVPIFHQKFLPYISVIFNCIYWEPRFPRIITDGQMANATKNNNSRLLGVCDITCDMEGSIQFLKKFTDMDQPFYMYDPITGNIEDGINNKNDQILFHAVDFLPTELPIDASRHFGSKLLPLLGNVIQSNQNLPLEEQGLCYELERSVIACQGSLTKKFLYINHLRRANESMKKMKGYQPKTGKPLQIRENYSFKAISFSGNIFRTLAINDIWDALEKYECKFNFLNWKIGNNQLENSSVSLFLFPQTQEQYEQVCEEIYIIIKNKGLHIGN